MHRTIATLRGNVFVERIPSDPLDEMSVFSDFVDAFPWHIHSYSIESG
jgi:hypothetical protein